jgi:hypothetical protein
MRWICGLANGARWIAWDHDYESKRTDLPATLGRTVPGQAAEGLARQGLGPIDDF